MPLVSNYDLVFYNAMEELCENFGSIESSYSLLKSESWMCVEALLCQIQSHIDNTVICI